MTVRSHRARQYAGKITRTGNEVCNLLTAFDANKRQDLCGFAIDVSLPIVIRAILVCDRLCNIGWNRMLCGSRGAGENGEGCCDWKYRSHVSSFRPSLMRLNTTFDRSQCMQRLRQIRQEFAAILEPDREAHQSAIGSARRKIIRAAPVQVVRHLDHRLDAAQATCDLDEVK